MVVERCGGGEYTYGVVVKRCWVEGTLQVLWWRVQYRCGFREVCWWRVHHTDSDYWCGG